MGGLLGYLMRQATREQPIKLSRATLEAVASGFVGVITMFLCHAIGLPWYWSGAVVRQTDLLCAGVGGGEKELFCEDARDALLEAGREVGDVDVSTLHLGLIHLVQHGGLEAGEADVVLALHMRHRQTVGFRVAGLGGVGDAGTAGIGQAQRPGHLVEGFAGLIQPLV